MKVAVLVGGLEREASFAHGRSICELLQAAEHEAVLVDIEDNLPETLRAERPDVCFVAALGQAAGSGQLQELLEFLDIPYAGTAAAVCRDTFDKALLAEHMRTVCAFIGEPTAATWPVGFTFSDECLNGWGGIAALEAVAERVPGGYPLAVKPAHGGMAYGVHKANDLAELRDAVRDALTFDSDVIVQQWIEGVELSVCVLGSGWDAMALPPVEIEPKRGLFLTEARLDEGAASYYAPVRLESLSSDESTAQAIRAEIERAALEVYRAFGLEGYGRVDVIWDGAQACVLEVDVAPNLSEGSMFASACEAAGLSMPAVLDRLLEI